MSFGQAFATAFLNGLTGQILESRKETREEVKRRKRIAETIGLPQYIKRQKNFNSYKNIAETLVQDYGADPELIKVLATDPEKLLGASEYIEKFKAKYDGRNITPARINGFLGSLRLATPTKLESIADAAKIGAGLAVDNTDLEAEKADPSKMEDNFLFSILGLNSDDRVRQKLMEQKVGGNFNYNDLYRMGTAGDATSDTLLGGFDYSFLPQEISATEVRNIEDSFEKQVVAKLTADYQRLSTAINAGSPSEKTITDFNTVSRLYEDYNRDEKAAALARAKYGGLFIANKMRDLGQIESIIRGANVTDAVALSAIENLLEDPSAVETFGEDELQKLKQRYGDRVIGTKERPIGQQKINNEDNDDKGLGADGKDDKVTNEKPPAPKEAVDELLAPENRGDFINSFNEFIQRFDENSLPNNLPPELHIPKGKGNRRLREKWRATIGKYYNDDGTRKAVVEKISLGGRRSRRRDKSPEVIV
jgi:hypothetical protein